MIKFKGKAINFSSYMPKKTTRHRIKVFACTCAPKGYLLSHIVSVGGSYTKETGIKVRIVTDLCEQTGMTNYVGVDIYADNWYCMAAVVKILWELYRWLFTGTQNLSSKYDRLEEDFPFPQMSNATIQKLGCGWQRNATRFIEASNGDKCCLLATTWIDKKQIGFRKSGTIVDQKGYTTRRHVKGQRMRKEITCPQVQQEYAKYFNGVDKNDRDSSDYTVSLKTN
jgi:hypothetical protein